MKTPDLKASRKNHKNFSKIIFTALFYIGLIVVWQLAYFILAEKLKLVKTYIFPNPLGIFKTYGKLMDNNVLITAILSSMRKMFTGFGISLLFGLILGLIITRFQALSSALKPLILGLQTLPSICWVPFAILWFGLSEKSTIFVIVVGSMFSISIAIESAIKNVNPLFIRAAKTMGTSKINIYIRVIFPSSIPELISGLKQGWSFAWRALMAGEIISVTGKIGLGYILLTGREYQNINQVTAVMIVIILISVLFEKLVFGKAESISRKKMGLDRK